MRLTLRRSCDACAKSKLSCDLRTPQCSRCTKKNTVCVYANQPLTSLLPGTQIFDHSETSPKLSSLHNSVERFSILLTNSIDSSVDPFNSYPRTKLARIQEQRLIQHFLSNIAFQYYPLDLHASTNPFIVSWWPLALSDPALFHVSLQTASLDIDLRDRTGFTNSEILMTDSISLVRKQIEDPSLALRDTTINSVITLAAIEFGKGNTDIGKMHIDGIINMVHLRGGIQRVKFTSPLTARMVPWVSLILTHRPQFTTQDDFGTGVGIAPISPWTEVARTSKVCQTSPFDDLDLDPTTSKTLWLLRELLHNSEPSVTSTTNFHDMTCFVLHRMLGQPSVIGSENDPANPPMNECVRKSIALYMLMIHGPTYFSHADLQKALVQDLRTRLGYLLSSLLLSHSSVALWLLSVGIIASKDRDDLQWFRDRAKGVVLTLNLFTWEMILVRIRTVLWFSSWQIETLVRDHWTAILGNIAT
ncbi:hypothetical protein J1614_008454 [Plenodomus biglobosus]|nr:hypothetical protein J1614_008454 [Plenodomus biglobosus]